MNLKKVLFRDSCLPVQIGPGVFQTLTLNRLADKQSGVGLVDHDPAAIPSKKMAEYVSIKNVGSITLFRHQRYQECTLVQLSPRIEEWFIAIAKSLKLDLSTFNLPADGKKLHQMQRYEKLQGFDDFLDEIANSGHKEVVFLKECLNVF